MKQPTSVSLFSGLGGMDYGPEAAGFQNLLAIESDTDCCDTLLLNRPHWNVIHAPIETISDNNLIKNSGLKIRELDLLSGGPPCQPFSKSGQWKNGETKRLKDKRANTLSEFMRSVNCFLPKCVLIENVQGFIFKGKDEGLKYITLKFKSINKYRKTNYIPYVFNVDMANYGIPQHRERIFIIAFSDGSKFDFPTPTHGTEYNLKPFVTAWDAIRDCKMPCKKELGCLMINGKWGDLLPSIPEGQNYLWHTSKFGGENIFGWRTRYWSFLLKLAKNQPSWTIQSQPGPSIGPFHWDNRRLSHDELCRLMTFPKIQIVGKRSSIQRQAGNAVPSLMIEIIGRQIIKQLTNMITRKPLKLAISIATTIPPKNRIRKIPTKYLPLIGNHADHPGTGLGPGAQKRVKS